MRGVLVVWLVLRVACRLRGGHHYAEGWRRVQRADGGVELQHHERCTRCPTTDTDGNHGD